MAKWDAKNYTMAKLLKNLEGKKKDVKNVKDQVYDFATNTKRIAIASLYEEMLNSAKKVGTAIAELMKKDEKASMENLMAWKKELAEHQKKLAEVSDRYGDSKKLYSAIKKNLDVMVDRMDEYMTVQGDVKVVEAEKQQKTDEYLKAHKEEQKKAEELQKAQEKEREKREEKAQQEKYAAALPEKLVFFEAIAQNLEGNDINYPEDKLEMYTQFQKTFCRLNNELKASKGVVNEENAPRIAEMIAGIECFAEEYKKASEKNPESAANQKIRKGLVKKALDTIKMELSEMTLVKENKAKYLKTHDKNNIIGDVKYDNNRYMSDAENKFWEKHSAMGDRENANEIWRKIRRIKNKMADTNASLFTKQSNQFRDLRNTIGRLDEAFEMSKGMLTKDNKERIATLMVAVNKGEKEYMKHVIRKTEKGYDPEKDGDIKKYRGAQLKKDPVRSERVKLTQEMEQCIIDLNDLDVELALKTNRMAQSQDTLKILKDVANEKNIHMLDPMF